MQQSAIKISVIIPCFNGSKYLKRCVQSILDQSKSVYEIIIVDDCSTDGSAEIIEQMQHINNQIRAIKLEQNGGVSRARNKGIECATGDYVTFVDVDDLLPNGAIEHYIKAVRAYPGLKIYQGVQINTDYPNTQFVEKENIGTYDSYLFKRLCLGYPRSRLMYPELSYSVKDSVHGCYGKLYSLDAINTSKTRFQEGLGLGEDLLFYYKMLQVSDKICVFDSSVYQLVLEDGSATRSYNPKMSGYALSFSKIISAVETDESLQTDLSYQINQHINAAIRCYFSNSDNTCGLFQRTKELRKLLSERVIHNAYDILVHSEYGTGMRKLKYLLLRDKLALCYLLVERLSR